MHKNIMVSYDGSKESLHAIEEAKELLSTSPDMKLSIVQVTNDGDYEAPIDVSWYGQMNEYSTIDPSVVSKIHDRFMEQKLSRMHKELDGLVSDIPNRVGMYSVVQAVSIADSLIDFAEHHDIDLIIMGCRGLGAIRGVLGSVSYAMLRTSIIPVLIVK